MESGRGRPGKNFRLESVLAAVPVGIGVADNGTIVEVNDRLLELSGFSRDEIIGIPVRTFFVDQSIYEILNRDLSLHPQEDEVHEREATIRKKDGSYFDALVRIATLYSDEEKRELTFAILDITEQKKAQRALESRIFALTSPVSQVGTTQISFQDLFNLEEIQEIQDAFAKATGVASIITDIDGTPITRPSEFTCFCSQVVRGTEQGFKNCRRSDAILGAMHPSGPAIQPCLSGGLWDGGTAITVGDRHIANWLVGQVIDEDMDLEKIHSYAQVIGADQVSFDEALAQVPRMSRARFEKICQALFLIAKQLSTLAYRNLQQGRAIVERYHAEESLRASESRLSGALAEKEALLRELHHRTKNNLEVVSSLLRLEADRSHEGVVQETFQDMVDRISSMGLVHEMFYGAKDLSWLDLGQYTEELVSLLVRSRANRNGTVKVSTDCDTIHVLIDTALPFGLLLNELVVNSFRHAFPAVDFGTILVSLKMRPDESIELCLQDDGVGLPEGMDVERDGNMGMMTILALAKQLNGTLGFSSGIGGRGLAVTLRFTQREYGPRI